jgi:hypothetical protein
MALQVNSVPLLETLELGLPRRLMIAVKLKIVRESLLLRWATFQRRNNR